MKHIIALVLMLGFANAQAQTVADGQKAYDKGQCKSCHGLGSKKEPAHVGPPLYGVTKRPGRTKEWLIAWISDPEAMLKTDKLAQQLLKESNGVPMTGMLKVVNGGNLDAAKKDAAAIYEFLKDNDSKPEGGGAAPKKKN